MSIPLKIDFVSDVACPWCAIGLNALERALERLDGEVQAEVHFQPFELNPDMPAQGEDASAYLTRKYGTTPAQQATARQRIRERGAEVGFEFGERKHVWNTFDAHRLLHWAGLQRRQRELKHALLRAYHGRGENPAGRDVLVRAAGEAGLDAEAAGRVFDSGAYEAEVREQLHHWHQMGIHAVPSVIVDDEHLIQGGHPPEVFEQALRQIAAQREA
jgi:predicted DsbA family dithiol-disulfide isomerase